MAGGERSRSGHLDDACGERVGLGAVRTRSCRDRLCEDVNGRRGHADGDDALKRRCAPATPSEQGESSGDPEPQLRVVAAFDSLRIGASSVGVGVCATASYAARSTAPSSRRAVAHADASPRRAPTRCEIASAIVRSALRGSGDMGTILGPRGRGDGSGTSITEDERDRRVRRGGGAIVVAVVELAQHPLELLYVSWDLQPIAETLGYREGPFPLESSRRAHLRAELDAAFFPPCMGLSDRTPTTMDTFSIVRRRDEKEHSEYRTKRLIMDCYEAMATSMAEKPTYA